MLEVTAAQMKELERKASEGGLSYEDMMENAGQAAARILLEQLPGLRMAAVVCGRGNNGGDGFVAARKLFEAGCCVHICLRMVCPAHRARPAPIICAHSGLGYLSVHWGQMKQKKLFSAPHKPWWTL